MTVMVNAGIVCLMAVGIVWASWQLGKLPKTEYIIAYERHPYL
jgi:hypothetical protein